ncbi:NusG domain II-containing protein [Mobilitalea sibirica]|uniref:NusG domain II-containing protein n=1 Tax=Mobilitalea sibirica TaxID=1462919 RepID=A0A8J7H861_9FIRM|nr:NusG domain II-containing protein [Mobilitalea sibirica]MBH1941401.1 NusG domain II-containing protein [Mobilitalea sibirica]
MKQITEQQKRKDDTSNQLIRKQDIILIGAVLFLGLIVFIVMQITKTEGSKVKIFIDNVEYKTLDLNIDMTEKVELDNGEWNLFEIKDGKVDMLDASCPDKICVNHKDIHYNTEDITCLPNKVVLKITGGEENEVDAVAN